MWVRVMGGLDVGESHGGLGCGWESWGLECG